MFLDTSKKNWLDEQNQFNISNLFVTPAALSATNTCEKNGKLSGKKNCSEKKSKTALKFFHYDDFLRKTKKKGIKSGLEAISSRKIKTLKSNEKRYVLYVIYDY